MNQKFKTDDIIARSIIIPGNRLIIARVIGQRGPEYYLLYLDNSSGWHNESHINEKYKKLGWNVEFFNLFVAQ